MSKKSSATKAPAKSATREPGARAKRTSTPYADRERDPRQSFDGPMLGTFGVPGLKRHGGYLTEEFHPDLRGRKKDKVFREMEDNSPLIGGALWAMEALVRQVEWRFDPKKKTGAAGQELADWYEGAREDTESLWEEIISEIMSMPTHGWALLEILYKLRRGDSDLPELRSEYDDGLFGWRDFSIRAQDSRLRWEYADDGTLLGMWQQVETEGRLRFIPLEKALLFRFRSRKSSPEGRSLLRNIYRSYHFATNEEEMEAVGIERNLNGYPVFEVPLSVLHKHGTAADRGFKSLAEEAVKLVRFDTATGLVIPCAEDRQGVTGFKFSFLSPNGDPAAANVAIMRHRTDMLIGLLMQFLLLGSGPTGSWSLASEMTDLLAMAMNAVLRAIAGVFSRVAVPLLGRLNGFDRQLLPALSFTDIEKPDVLKLWQSLQAAVSSGIVVPGDELDSWAREQSGWPPKEGTSMPRQAPALSPLDPAAALGLRAKSSSARLFRGRPLSFPGL